MVPGERSTETNPAESSGLDPAHSRAWLQIQTELAFHPERFAAALRSGRPPEALLREAGLAPAYDDARMRRLVERHRRVGARLVPIPDPAYPAVLRAVDDAPLVLSVRGRPERLSGPAVAIVGSRAATLAARRFAFDLARELARAGIAVVSGLARGIDAEAHRGALEAGGVTIGVLACGIDRVYPPEHRGLAAEIERSGAVVSELPVGTLPRPLHFPLRNRIISGLARAVVVVEARRRSGSLITVRHALDQGREVFAVPGPVEGPFAAGTNQLLRDGARVIQSARDLIDDLGLRAERPRRSPRSDLRPESSSGSRAVARGLGAQVVARLAEGPRAAADLLAETGAEPEAFATALLELELAGRIAEERDGRIHLCLGVDDRGARPPSLRCAPPEPEEIPP